MALGPDAPFLSLKAPWRENYNFYSKVKCKKGLKAKGCATSCGVWKGQTQNAKKKRYSSYWKQVYDMVIRADDGRTSKKTESSRMPTYFLKSLHCIV